MDLSNKAKGANNKARIRQRQEEAFKRQKERNNRTAEQQLKLIDFRPGNSKKEKYKLVTLIENAFNKAAKMKKKKKKKNV